MVEPKRSEKGKKSGFFRGMLDGLRSTVGQPSTAAGVKAILDAEVEELLKPSNFTVKTVGGIFFYSIIAFAIAF